MRFEIFEERDAHGFKSSGSWRWRARSANGKITANGGEPFTSASHARRAVRQFCESLSEMLGDGLEPLIAEVDA